MMTLFVFENNKCLFIVAFNRSSYYSHYINTRSVRGDYCDVPFMREMHERSVIVGLFERLQDFPSAYCSFNVLAKISMERACWDNKDFCKTSKSHDGLHPPNPWWGSFRFRVIFNWLTITSESAQPFVTLRTIYSIFTFAVE